MKMYTEPSKQLPIADETDVLVVGGGVAGIAAAVAAARHRAKVTLIEKSIILGGLATLGHVCIYLPIDDGVGNKVYGGLAEELLYTSIKYSYDNLPDCWRGGPMTVENTQGYRYLAAFNIPAAVLAYDELCEAEGINVVFDAAFSEPIMEDGVCKGIIVEDKSGRSAYLAKMVIDATGDADVFYRAGAPCETQKTIVSHWTQEISFDTMKEAIEKQDLMSAVPLRWFGVSPQDDLEESTVPCFYGTTTEDVNAYIKTSRKLALDYIKTKDPKEYAMMTMPYMIQGRMTRRLIGKAEFEVTQGKHVESSVGCAIFSLEKPAKVYEFPYEGLIDANIPNMLAAGRIVSATGRGWEIMRFIPACVLTGQAAGTAAALAIQEQAMVQNIDIAALQKQLENDGVIVHMTAAMRENQDKVPEKCPDNQMKYVRRTDAPAKVMFSLHG